MEKKEHFGNSSFPLMLLCRCVINEGKGARKRTCTLPEKKKIDLHAKSPENVSRWNLLCGLLLLSHFLLLFTIFLLKWMECLQSGKIFSSNGAAHLNNTPQHASNRSQEEKEKERENLFSEQNKKYINIAELYVDVNGWFGK